MSFREQMKHKAEEVEFQAKAKDLGDAVIELARTAVSALADLTQQNRTRIDETLGRLGQTIDEQTEGKHTETVTKVRAQIGRGLDKLVEQGDRVRPQVPDDTHSAFAEDPIDPPSTPGPGTPTQD